MTTVIVDRKNRKIASDSLMTIDSYRMFHLNPFTSPKKLSTEYQKDVKKLFEYRKGVILATIGNTALTDKILKKFGITDNAGYSGYNKGDLGRVLITNPYTDTICVITITATGEYKTENSYGWVNKGDEVSCGSGFKIASACYKKGLAIADCIRYASYKDRHTGGKIVVLDY